MENAEAIQEAITEWNVAIEVMVNFMIVRCLDPRGFSAHARELLALKVERVQRASRELARRIQHVIRSPLLLFIPPILAEGTPRYEPATAEELEELRRPRESQQNGSSAWSTGPEAGDNDDEIGPNGAV